MLMEKSGSKNCLRTSPAVKNLLSSLMILPLIFRTQSKTGAISSSGGGLLEDLSFLSYWEFLWSLPEAHLESLPGELTRARQEFTRNSSDAY